MANACCKQRGYTEGSQIRRSLSCALSHRLSFFITTCNRAYSHLTTEALIDLSRILGRIFNPLQEPYTLLKHVWSTQVAFQCSHTDLLSKLLLDTSVCVCGGGFTVFRSAAECHNAHCPIPGSLKRRNYLKMEATTRQELL